MALQIKAILHRGPNETELPKKEIRRFEVDESAVGSYEYFRQKVVSLYPDLSNESPFRLMWTDEEGDNVCFSSDEELAQAVKFIRTQENKLFKVIVRFPPSHYEKPEAKKVETPAAHPNEFSVPPQSCGQNPFRKNFDRRAGRIQEKVMKNLAKLHHLHGNNPTMAQHILPHFQQLGQVTKCTVNPENGDVDMHVDIPIHHSDGSTSTGSTSTTTKTVTDSTGATTSQTNMYPNLDHQETQMQTEGGFEDVSKEIEEAKLNEAVAKMAELGFTGNWVRELLKTVDGDITKAVEAMNPAK